MPRCVRRVASSEVHISCQHIDFLLSWKELRYPLVILTFCPQQSQLVKLYTTLAGADPLP